MSGGTHVARVERIAPGTWTRYRCTCGRQSERFGHAGLAQLAAEAHTHAHGGWVRSRDGRDYR